MSIDGIALDDYLILHDPAQVVEEWEVLAGLPVVLRLSLADIATGTLWIVMLRVADTIVTEEGAAVLPAAWATVVIQELGHEVPSGTLTTSPSRQDRLMSMSLELEGLAYRLDGCIQWDESEAEDMLWLSNVVLTHEVAAR